MTARGGIDSGLRSGEGDLPVAALVARLEAAGELDARVRRELVRVEADAVHAETERLGVAVADFLPVVEAGMQREGCLGFDIEGGRGVTVAVGGGRDARCGWWC
jgi:hypothetical protein